MAISIIQGVCASIWSTTMLVSLFCICIRLILLIYFLVECRGCQSDHRGRASSVKLHFFAEFRSIPFRASELALPRNSECLGMVLSSAEQRKPFRVYSAEFFRNEIPFPTLAAPTAVAAHAAAFSVAASSVAATLVDVARRDVT